MTKNILHNDERGVSSVLGAIMVFGLLVLTLTVVQTEFVPVWDKQRERDQSLLVIGQASVIKADLDRIAAGQVGVTLSEPISLVRERGFTFYGSEVVPGTARFTPTVAGAGLRASTPNPIALQQSSGQSLYGLNDDWSWNGTNLFNVLQVVHMRARIPNPGGLPTGTQTLTVTVADVNSYCVGQFVVVATGTTGTTKSLEQRVFPAQIPAQSSCAASAIDVRQSYVGNGTPSHVYFNPLVETEFKNVLAAISPNQYPLRVSYTQGNTGAQVALVYDQNTAFGRIRSGSSGLVSPNLNDAYPTGTLSISLNQQRLPSQTFAFEYGAVLVQQHDGSAMVSEPGFSVSSSSGQAMLSWAFPTLAGGSAAVSGAPAATLAMTPSGGGGRAFLAQDIALRIDTAYPAAWSNFWAERMTLAGLSQTPVASQAPCAILSPAPQYAITTTATSATLTFYGPCSSPGDTTRDVLVSLFAGGATVALQPAG